MQLRWLVDPITYERKLQYRESGNNGVFGPGSVVYDTGWVDIPEVFDEPGPPTIIDCEDLNIPILPENCRERLRLKGHSYPKSGCAVCGNGGMMGCPYIKENK